MPISTDVPQSPGWWLDRLSRKLLDRKRQARLDLLGDYFAGRPPLPAPADPVRQSFASFCRKSRSNFAELVVSATRERMIPVGFRTGSDADETGDARASEVWQRAGLAVESADVHEAMLTFGEGYVIVGAPDEESGAPLVTAEDPRQVVAVTDPARPRTVIAALKMFHDDVAEEHLAYLYLPGEVHVAVRPGKATTRPVAFSGQSWDWDPQRSRALPQALSGTVPVVQFCNHGGVGEFELHIDLLDRINHMILQRLVIATLQAFRQRAAIGLPERDEQGAVIDYTDVFSADPGALWQLPDGASLWESGQVDLTPILSSVKDDVQHLAVVTRTPFSMLMPEGANQSAEGASLQREGLVFKAEDRIARADPAWSRVMSLAFRWLDDAERADLAKLQPIWRSAERLSLAERADAASKATDVPWRTKMISIWGWSPDQVDRMESERAADQALEAAFAPPVAKAPAPPPGAPPVAPVAPQPAVTGGGAG